MAEANIRELTHEEHIARHRMLHRHFDELLADYMNHHPGQLTFLDMPVERLMRWSFQQTRIPDELSTRPRKQRNGGGG